MIKRLRRLLGWALMLPAVAAAQSVPNGGAITTGQVWTATQWNTAWQSKQDYPITCGALPALTGAITSSGCTTTMNYAPITSVPAYNMLVNATNGTAAVGNKQIPVYWATFFGADPTCATYSDAAINLALQALQQSGKIGMVYLPPGCYKIQNELDVGTTNVVQALFGAGRSITQIEVDNTFNSSAAAAIQLKGQNGALKNGDIVRDLTIRFVQPLDITATTKAASGIGTTSININNPTVGASAIFAGCEASACKNYYVIDSTGVSANGSNGAIPQWSWISSVTGSSGNWTINLTGPGGISTVGSLVAGSGYANGTYTNVLLCGPDGAAYGSGGMATVTVAGNVVTGATITAAGRQYRVGEVLTACNPSEIGGTVNLNKPPAGGGSNGTNVAQFSGSGFSVTITAVTAYSGIVAGPGGSGVANGDTIIIGSPRDNYQTLAAGCTTTAGGTGCRYPPAILSNISPVPFIDGVQIEGAWDGIVRCPSEPNGATWCNPNAGGGQPANGFAFDHIFGAAIHCFICIENIHDSGWVNNIKVHPRFLTQANSQFTETNTRDIVQLDIYTDGNARAARIGATDGMTSYGFNTFQGCIEFMPGTFGTTNSNTGWSYGKMNGLALDGGACMIIDQDLTQSSFIRLEIGDLYVGSTDYGGGPAGGCVISVNEASSFTSISGIHAAQAAEPIICLGGTDAGDFSLSGNSFMWGSGNYGGEIIRVRNIAGASPYLANYVGYSGGMRYHIGSEVVFNGASSSANPVLINALQGNARPDINGIYITTKQSGNYTTATLISGAGFTDQLANNICINFLNGWTYTAPGSVGTYCNYSTATGVTNGTNAAAGNIGEIVGANCQIAATATVTFTQASPGIVTWTSPPFSALGAPTQWTCPINFTTAGTFPTGLVPFSANAVSGITQANPMVATVSTVIATNPFAVGTTVLFTGVVGMTQVNGNYYSVTAIGGSSGAWTATFGAVNSTGFTAYSSGGTATTGNYWAIGSTLSGNTFQIADSAAHALAATNAINFTSAGSGTQTGILGAGATTATVISGAGVAISAGDWDCNGMGDFVPVGITGTGYNVGLSTTDGGNGGTGNYAAMRFTSLTQNTNSPVGPIQFNNNVAKTIFLSDNAIFSAGSMTEGGTVRCRRMH